MVSDQIRPTRTALGLFSLALSACAVNPVAPARPPLPASYGTVAAASGATAISDASHLREDQSLHDAWWTLYRSDALNQLVADALAHNASIEAATHSLRQAGALYQAATGQTLPSVNAQIGVSRDRANAAQMGLSAPPSSYDLYNAGVTVSYTLDLFGGVHQQIQSMQAQVDQQTHQLRGLQLALSANLVTAVVRDAQYREQIVALQAVIDDQQQNQQLLEQRFAVGAIARADVLNQQTALALAQAALVPVERARDQNVHAIAVYLGQTPDAALRGRLDQITLQVPPELPIGVPSELVRQRPDILVADAQLRAAAAQFGVASANLYPQITLAASLGYDALQPAQLFQTGSLAWGLSAGVLQPLFRGGALQAQKQAAGAALDQAAANYRQTVLTAFANVSDALAALGHDAVNLRAQTQAQTQAHQNLDLVRLQFQVGSAGALNLLLAEQQWRQAGVAVAQARADRLADTAALLQSVGGGDWHAVLATSDPVSLSNSSR